MSNDVEYIKNMVKDTVERQHRESDKILQSLMNLYGDKFHTEGIAHYRRLAQENNAIEKEREFKINSKKDFR